MIYLLGKTTLADRTWLLDAEMLAESGGVGDAAAVRNALGLGTASTEPYEEGTWSPIFVPQSGSFASIAYDPSTFGRYTKVGRLVSITGRLMTDSISIGTASGLVSVGNLPFTATPLNSPGFVGFSSSFAGNNPSSMQGADTSMLLHYRSTANGDSGFVGVADLSTGADGNQLIFGAVFETT